MGRTDISHNGTKSFGFEAVSECSKYGDIGGYDIVSLSALIGRVGSPRREVDWQRICGEVHVIGAA